MDDGDRRIVVVIDDDAAVRESLRFFLESAGHTVETYASAWSFIQTARPAHTICLLLDQQMPEVTGLQLLEILRRLHDMPPVLLVTAASDAGLAREAAALGVRKVLLKPLADVDLLAEIRAAAVEEARRDAASSGGGSGRYG